MASAMRGGRKLLETSGGLKHIGLVHDNTPEEVQCLLQAMHELAVHVIVV